MQKGIIKKIGSIFLAFATIGSLLFGVYTWVYEKKPSIRISILGKTDVLEVNRRVDNLKILYQNLDIEKENKKLSIMKYRIENNGNADVLQNMYDTENNWGVLFKNAKIISITLSDASSDYVKQNIKISIEENKIQFNKIIFEKKAFFDFEVLLLYDNNTQPSCNFYGKIAGINNDLITIIQLNAAKSTLTFWQSVFYGRLGVQVTRFFIFLIIDSIFIVALIGIVISIQEKIASSKKKKRKLTIKNKGININPKYETLLDFYVDNGGQKLKDMYKLVNDKKLLRERIVLKHNHNVNITNDLDVQDIFENNQSRYISDPIIRYLSVNKYYNLTTKGISIDSDFCVELEKLLVQLQ